MKTMTLASLIALFALEGCAVDQPVGLITPEFGEAVRHNIAAETVNPSAPMDNSALITDGQRAAIGQERYITDTVEKPAAVGTQSTQGGEGSGSNGASAGGAAGAR